MLLELILSKYPKPESFSMMTFICSRASALNAKPYFCNGKSRLKTDQTLQWHRWVKNTHQNEMNNRIGPLSKLLSWWDKKILSAVCASVPKLIWLQRANPLVPLLLLKWFTLRCIHETVLYCTWLGMTKEHGYTVEVDRKVMGSNPADEKNELNYWWTIFLNRRDPWSSG